MATKSQSGLLIHKPVGGSWQYQEVKNFGLEAFQALVGGWIESLESACRTPEHRNPCGPFDLLVNEEGRLLGLPLNLEIAAPFAIGHDPRGLLPVVGPVVVVRRKMIRGVWHRVPVRHGDLDRFLALPIFQQPDFMVTQLGNAGLSAARAAEFLKQHEAHRQAATE